MLQHRKDRAVLHTSDIGLRTSKELREVVFLYKSTAVFCMTLILLLRYVARETQQTGSKIDSNNCKVLQKLCPPYYKFSACDLFAQNYYHLV